MRPLYVGRLLAAPEHSLARANGWGSAGQCPASVVRAKTPAVGEVCRHVVAGESTVFATCQAASSHREPTAAAVTGGAIA